MRLEPPPRPVAARPARKRDNAQAQTRTGNPSQICHFCNEPSIEECAGRSRRTGRGRLATGTRRRTERAWKK
eukprot:82638-Pyramimonas_sp.AAC.1